MTPAVPDPTVEALSVMEQGEGVEFYAKVLDASGFELAAATVRDVAARAAAPDALRTKLEAALADSRNQWWHTGGTPCVPRRVIAALLEDGAQ
jgi:hypothetical protein